MELVTLVLRICLHFLYKGLSHYDVINSQFLDKILLIYVCIAATWLIYIAMPIFDVTLLQILTST